MSELKIYIEGNYTVVETVGSGDLDYYPISDTGITKGNNDVITIFDTQRREDNKKALWSQWGDKNGGSIGNTPNEVLTYLTDLTKSIDVSTESLFKQDSSNVLLNKIVEQNKEIIKILTKIYK